MTEDVLEKAWEVLRAHVGHDHPITSAELSRLLKVGDDKRGTRGTRALIAELVRRGMPIGATEEGYFVLENRIELERYRQELRDRAQAILLRDAQVDRAFEQYHQGEAHQAFVRWVPEDPEERV